jgi:glutamate carboxypeptidase
MQGKLAVLLADIEELVRCESPSSDLAAVARSAEVVARIGTRWLGVEPEPIVVDGRVHLRWRLGSGPARVLLLGHHDTVWPIGSIARLPFSITDGVLRGPGCFDMKAGVVLAFAAVAALPDRRGVSILVTGDEEIGSPSSRALIEAEAAGCAAVLVLEAAAEGGALKTERKGVSMYRLEIAGRASHAGLNPEAGINAGVELAHQVLAVARLADAERGTTVTPTMSAAGSAVNTVPAAATLAVDVRARDATEQHRVDAAMRELTAVLAGAQLRVLGGINRAPLERAASAELYARAARIAGRLGMPPLAAVAVGGASDGNFTAGIGIPTLDGLGATGGGAHADDEHVITADLPGRAALVTALLTELLADAAAPDVATPARLRHP